MLKEEQHALTCMVLAESTRTNFSLHGANDDRILAYAQSASKLCLCFFLAIQALTDSPQNEFWLDRGNAEQILAKPELTHGLNFIVG